MKKLLASAFALVGLWCFRAAERLDPAPPPNEEELAAFAEWLGVQE